MKQWLTLLILSMSVVGTFGELRIWTDLAGNSIKAELVNKSGDQIIIRDQKGKTYRFHQKKLSDIDQQYLNTPPPVEYKILLAKLSRAEFMEKTFNGQQVREKTDNWHYEFMLRVEREDGEALPEGLAGKLFVFGKEVPDGSYVVIDKAEAEVELISPAKGEVKGYGCTLHYIRDKKGVYIKGTRYGGYLVVLLSADGTVLAEKCSHGFLKDYEKAMALNVGDYFDRQLVKYGMKK